MADAALGIAPQKKHSLFASKPQQSFDSAGMSADMNNMGRRLRLLEESFTNMRRSVQVTEENILQHNREFSKEIKSINSEIVEIRNELSEVKDRILQLITELKGSAKREEVKILEKYISLWNPVKFVTQAEVERMVRELMAEEKSRKFQ